MAKTGLPEEQQLKVKMPRLQGECHVQIKLNSKLKMHRKLFIIKRRI